MSSCQGDQHGQHVIKIDFEVYGCMDRVMATQYSPVIEYFIFDGSNRVELFMNFAKTID
eukprot:403356980